MALFVRDFLNPLGVQYSATARTAESADATRQSMDDMLLLALAGDETERRSIAGQILARRQVDARRARAGRRVRNVLLLLIVAFFVVVWQLGDPHSALSGAARAFVAAPLPNAPDRTPAPVRAVRAPAAQEFIDPAIARGENAMRAATIEAAQDGEDVGVWCARHSESATCAELAD